MAACAQNVRARRKSGNKRFRPRANHHRNPIHENYVDAAVRQDALCEFGRRTYRLSPETKQIFCEGPGVAGIRGNRKLQRPYFNRDLRLILIWTCHGPVESRDSELPIADPSFSRSPRGFAAGESAAVVRTVARSRWSSPGDRFAHGWP